MHSDHQRSKKPNRPTVRPINRVVLRLHGLQLGLSIEDMDLLTVGQLLDLFNEMHNDRQEWPIKGDGSMLRQMFM